MTRLASIALVLSGMCGFLTAGPTPVRAADQDYVLTGIQAWSHAKSNGFTFKPRPYASGQTVTTPHDGVDTKLQAITTLKTTTFAQIVGGNASVNRPFSGSVTVAFDYFGSMELAVGWTVQKVELSGNYIWDRTVSAGTRDMSFRVKATSTSTTTGSFIVKSVTLRGPAGADPATAFVGTRLYTVAGTTVWGVAKDFGFWFAPTKYAPLTLSSSAFAPGTAVSSPRNGVDTRLTVNRILLQGETVCKKQASPGEYDTCLLGHVVGGNMIAYEALQGTSARVEYLMFSNRRLAPGWAIKSVSLSLSNGRWVRQPAAGTDDMSFEIELTPTSTTTARASLGTIVLEGPTNAAGWQDAFKNSIAP